MTCKCGSSAHVACSPFPPATASNGVARDVRLECPECPMTFEGIFDYGIKPKLVHNLDGTHSVVASWTEV